mmetsp:Transcript_60794/g.162719  ORF Transcript_60794/g.162719 Transcript_60794/m.162719 type:complete len:251 (-) Transcript_60794:406-1158(-)
MALLALKILLVQEHPHVRLRLHLTDLDHPLALVDLQQRAVQDLRLNLPDPAPNLMDALGVVQQVEAVRDPVGLIDHVVVCLDGRAGMQVVHVVEDHHADVLCCERLRTAIRQAQLRIQSRSEVQWQAPVAQGVRDPANLRQVLGAHQLEVTHHSRCDLVAHRAAGQRAGNLGKLRSIGTEHCGHEVRDGVIVHQVPHIFLVDLTVAVRVVLLHQLLRLCACEGLERVELRSDLEVLDGDEASARDVEKAE